MPNPGHLSNDKGVTFGTLKSEFKSYIYYLRDLSHNLYKPPFLHLKNGDNYIYLKELLSRLNNVCMIFYNHDMLYKYSVLLLCLSF